MLFRLTVLLAAGLFVAMYFAPNGSRPPAERAAPPAVAPSADEAADARTEEPAEPQAGTAPAPVLAPPPVAETDVEPAPAPAVEPAEAGLAAPSGGVQQPAPGGAVPGAVPDGAAEAATDAVPEAVPDAADPFAAATEAPETPAGAPLPDLGQLGAASNADAVSLSDSVRTRTAPEAVPPPPTRPGTIVARPGAAAPQAPAQPPVGPVTGPRAQVVATSVNLRAGPSTGASVLGRVSFGDVVVVVQPNAAPGWTGIRDPRTGQTAYISSQFLQVVP